MLPQEDGEMGRGGMLVTGNLQPNMTRTLDTGHWTTAVAKYNWCHLQLVPGIGGVIALPPSHGDHCHWRLGRGRERCRYCRRGSEKMFQDVRTQFLCLLSAVN